MGIVFKRELHDFCRSMGTARSVIGKLSKLILLLLVFFIPSKLWAQGPPFQIDDPVPVDLHHYEFYVFGGVDGTPAEIDSTGPALRVQLGRHSQGATPRHTSLGRCLPVEQSRLPAGRDGAERVRPDRHGIGRQNRLHQGVEVHSADWNFHDVRNPDGQFRLEGSAWGKSGTSFLSGCKRISGTGSSTEERAKRLSRKPDIATSPTGDSC